VDPVVAVRPVHSEPGAYATVIKKVTTDAEEVDQNAFVFGPEDIAGVRRRGYAGPPGLSLVYALTETTRSLFVPAEAHWRVLWSGELAPGVRSALVRARLDAGPAFQVFVNVDAGMDGDSSGRQNNNYFGAVRPVAWATADLAPWPYLATQDAGADDTPLLLLNPSGPGTAVIEGDNERTVRFDKNGVATVTSKLEDADHLFGSTVIVRAPNGRRIVRSALTNPYASDPFVVG